MLNFKPAVRSEAKARVAIIGPTGAGKTWTALEWASKLADGGSIAVIDTENASASLYADRFQFVTAPWWPPYDATKLAAAIKQAAKDYDVIVLDSLTHFWQGDGGVLDIVDREATKNRGNTYAGWKVGTPVWRGLLDALIFAPCHVVVTMRSKMEYSLNQSDGRTKVEKVGMAPVARNDVEYEFTVVGEMDQAHRLTVTKSRCESLADQVAPPHQAGALAETLRDWLRSADTSEPTERPEPTVPAPPADGPTDAQTRKAMAMFKEKGFTERDDRLRLMASILGREVPSFTSLTKAEAGKVIDGLESFPGDAETGDTLNLDGAA
jgi:hypothetical protein